MNSVPNGVPIHKFRLKKRIVWGVEEGEERMRISSMPLTDVVLEPRHESGTHIQTLLFFVIGAPNRFEMFADIRHTVYSLT